MYTANAQLNLCAKRLHGHQPCYHLELIREQDKLPLMYL